MVGNPIVVKMIESTIDKTIRDIKLDPQKGVKGLVELANRFANNPIQKDLVRTLQIMLENPNSPYHALIPFLVNTVNQHTLKTFIINMTYNSWSYGGKRIKQYKKSYNYNIPWTIIFDFTQEESTKLSDNTIINTIEQGKKLGIYTYMFFTNNLDNFSEIQKQNPDCAFVLYVPPTILTKEILSKIKSYHNTFFSVLYQPSLNTKAFKDATKLLYDSNCLFGSYSYYTDENIEYILSNQWISEVVVTASPLAFLIESPNCTPTNASLIHNYVDNSKTNQQYPTFLMDLYEDITQVSNQLSNHASIFKVLSNGDITHGQSTTPPKLNINNTTLLQVLSP